MLILAISLENAIHIHREMLTCLLKNMHSSGNWKHTLVLIRSTIPTSPQHLPPKKERKDCLLMQNKTPQKQNKNQSINQLIILVDFLTSTSLLKTLWFHSLKALVYVHRFLFTLTDFESMWVKFPTTSFFLISVITSHCFLSLSFLAATYSQDDIMHIFITKNCSIPTITFLSSLIIVITL